MARSQTSTAGSEKQRIERVLQAFTPTERTNYRATLKLYRRGKCTKFQEQKLYSAGLIGTAADQPSQTVDSQESLVESLRRHFAGRITVELSQPLISYWLRGTPGHGVPIGSPLPPSRNGNRYDVERWIEWVERYILPTHGQNGHAGPAVAREPSIFERAQEAEAERRIIERNRARRAEEIELGNFIPIQEHIGRLKIIGQVLNQAITESVEKTIVQTISDAAKVLPIDDQKMAEFRQQIQQACEAAADAQRSALAGAMLQATDKTL